MVDFWEEQAIPATTTEAKAKEVNLIIPSGIMHSGWVFFPAGCENLAHVTFNDAIRQIWPSDSSKSYIGNMFPIEIPDRHIVKDAFTKITINFWNDDDTEEHTVSIKFTVSQPEELSPLLATNKLLRRFLTRLRA